MPCHFPFILDNVRINNTFISSCMPNSQTCNKMILGRKESKDILSPTTHTTATRGLNTYICQDIIKAEHTDQSEYQKNGNIHLSNLNQRNSYVNPPPRR